MTVEYKRPETLDGLSFDELLEFFDWMNFKDESGHQLVLNKDFLELLVKVSSGDK